MKNVAFLLIALAVIASADTPDAPVVAGRDVPAPTRRGGNAAVYPDIAKGAGVESMILLRATVAADGHVTDIRLMRGLPLLDQAAIDAVKTWWYNPTVVDGVPRRVELVEAIPFFLGAESLARAVSTLAGDRSLPAYVRVEAIAALPRLRVRDTKGLMKTLQKIVGDPDTTVAKAAEAALAEIGKEVK
jgi:TonB family protein